MSKYTNAIEKIDKTFESYVKETYRGIQLTDVQIKEIRNAFAAGLITYLGVFQELLTECNGDEEKENEVPELLSESILAWLSPTKVVIHVVQIKATSNPNQN